MLMCAYANDLHKNSLGNVFFHTIGDILLVFDCVCSSNMRLSQSENMAFSEINNLFPKLVDIVLLVSVDEQI